MIRDIEESEGVVSMMRLGVQDARRWGGAMIGAGIMLAFAMLALDRYELIPVSVSLVAGGPSLIGLALGAKAWQAQAENKGG